MNVSVELGNWYFTWINGKWLGKIEGIWYSAKNMFEKRSNSATIGPRWVISFEKKRTLLFSIDELGNNV
jgi:hypothetical protein